MQFDFRPGDFVEEAADAKQLEEQHVRFKEYMFERMLDIEVWNA